MGYKIYTYLQPLFDLGILTPQTLLRVDDNLIFIGEPALIFCDHVYQLVSFLLFL